MMPFALSTSLHLKSKTRLVPFVLTGAAGLALLGSPALADGLSVVTTIKPLHSIASAVMEGVGTPDILIDGASSPHGFSLKPSQASQLQKADAVFWIGPELTPSLAKPISSMAENAVVVEMMEVDGIEPLQFRDSAEFDTHEHDEDDEEHEPGATPDEQHSHATEDNHGHDSGEDPHIWLNPDNGIAIASAMAETLSSLDPANSQTYRANARHFAERIEAIEQKISGELAPLTDRKFIVFHDAFHHFEHHFGVEASGAITLSPETLSSADRIAAVRDRIRDLQVTCVFQEPQFDAKLVDVVIEGSIARKGTLDPLGTDLADGPDLYPDLLEALTNSLTGCLGKPS